MNLVKPYGSDPLLKWAAELSVDQLNAAADELKQRVAAVNGKLASYNTQQEIDPRQLSLF
jgi:hypothetical protein